MRLALVLAVTVALLAPAVAGARNSPVECQHIAQQLVHFDAMKQRAAQLDNPLWVQRFKAHIAELEDRQAAACPDQSAALESAKQLRDLMKLAAEGALTFFTFGAY
jgi:membrane-bound lytic murein transglycosylase MltF